MKVNVSKQICHEEYIFKTAYFIKVDFKEYIFFNRPTTTNTFFKKYLFLLLIKQMMM